MQPGPGPAGRGQPQVAPKPARVALVLGCLAAAINLALDLWLHPHGVMFVVLTLASVVLAMTTGFAERVVPVPRQERDDEHPDG